MSLEGTGVRDVTGMRAGSHCESWQCGWPQFERRSAKACISRAPLTTIRFPPGGVFTGYVKDTVISHNSIYNTSYSAIGIGGGAMARAGMPLLN